MFTVQIFEAHNFHDLVIPNILVEIRMLRTHSCTIKHLTSLIYAVRNQSVKTAKSKHLEEREGMGRGRGRGDRDGRGERNEVHVGVRVRESGRDNGGMERDMKGRWREGKGEGWGKR